MEKLDTSPTEKRKRQQVEEAKWFEEGIFFSCADDDDAGATAGMIDSVASLLPKQ